MKKLFFMIMWKFKDFLAVRHRIDCISLVSYERQSSGYGRLFILLPFDIDLHCPKCGEPCQPKGNCGLEFKHWLNKEVRLVVFCDKCGCCHEPPILAEVVEKDKTRAGERIIDKELSLC